MGTQERGTDKGSTDRNSVSGELTRALDLEEELRLGTRGRNNQADLVKCILLITVSVLALLLGASWRERSLGVKSDSKMCWLLLCVWHSDLKENEARHQFLFVCLFVF